MCIRLCGTFCINTVHASKCILMHVNGHRHGIAIVSEHVNYHNYAQTVYKGELHNHTFVTGVLSQWFTSTAKNSSIPNAKVGKPL